VILWIIVTLFYSFVSLSMMKTMISFLGVADQVYNDPIYSYMVSNNQYIESLMFGFLFGTATFGINLAVDYTSIHYMSFGKTIILKTFLYSIAIAFIFFLMAGIIFTSGLSPVDVKGFQEFFSTTEISVHFYFGIAVFFIMSTLLINFIALVSKKFGPGQMFLIFLGKYNKPLTENRVFMFLDLKDSTTIAENLGHIVYSKLLQQCFLDLNKLIPISGAQIYQYVGDEAVLTWKVKHYDMNFAEPMKLFFLFKKKLMKRAKYYKGKFGTLPEFKAGVHAGVVTVAEIGDIKREIAYHGDVVNTASRLRSACNEFEKELLASEYVVRNIDKTEGHEIKEIGSVKLKGKKNSIKVFSIE
jgi:adenylate cyclase